MDELIWLNHRTKQRSHAKVAISHGMDDNLVVWMGSLSKCFSYKEAKLFPQPSGRQVTVLAEETLGHALWNLRYFCLDESRL